MIFEQLNDEWISLEKHISLTGKPGLDESIAKFIFQQVVDCVEALERIGFFHCNITTSNVLINIMTHEIKLTNFENVSEQMYSKTSQRVVSARRDSGVDATGTEKEFCFQESLEVLSLGLLLFELLFGVKPNINEDLSLDLSDVKISRDASLSLKLLLADEPDRIQFHAIQNLRFIAAAKFLVVSRRKRMMEDDAESYITSDSHFLELYPFNVPSDSFGSSESLQKVGIFKKIKGFFKRIKSWWI